MNTRLRNRRGFLAITFSVVMLLLVTTLMTAYTLSFMTAAVQERRAERQTQALYAAEAGLDVALQTRQPGTLSGEVGQGRYLARYSGGQTLALGAVEQANGGAVVVAVVSDGRLWLQRRATSFPDLYSQILEQLNQPEVGQP